MEEKIQKSGIENPATLEKIEWEAPKLYSLDKGKTEGGNYARGTEDDTYFYS